jgi:putative tryptophan/tyrosine transport system substrate-binding protein
MRRREFIALLGSGVAGWPLAARAQQSAMPVIGFLQIGSPEASVNLVAAFRKGLSEVGYVEGRNVAIEFRWAHNDSDRLPELAADLVHRRVAVIATPGSSAAAAKTATSTIPIVFGMGDDPVALGLVASLNRPGGNVTGISYMNIELGAKRLGLLHELLPGATRFAVLVDPNFPSTASIVADLQAAASTIGSQIEVLAAATSREIDAAFTILVQKHPEPLLISPMPLFYDRRVQILTLVARHAIPVIYPAREWAEAGGMISYGSSFADLYRQAGIYAGRVLKGEKPAELPVLRATKFELLINLQTARTLGFDIPATLLARADEVIE